MGVRKPMVRDGWWQKIEPLILPRPPRPKSGRPLADDRACLGGILWILKTGARWRAMPDQYPHHSPCWRRLRDWEEAGACKNMWRAFLSKLDVEGILDWEEVFVDATLFPGKYHVQSTWIFAVNHFPTFSRRTGPADHIPSRSFCI